MKSENIYIRKISSKEAKEGFIMILKNKLSFFPPLGDSFYFLFDNKPQVVGVESYPCTCRGPQLPHEHYFIRWNGLKTGDKVEIEKSPEKEDSYILRIQ